ncbi:hypothetical protein Pmi06nite_24450 [Planotetraspora mira]|uniref:Uncharacterized protein n=1 Tax=Planotetraspora mira TaxID=58121 RepID=A0A8J3TKZ7_9ACTN|nr:hypothetical protein Pmi06nite_24450 [Planotetraspora mira]
MIYDQSINVRSNIPGVIRTPPAVPEKGALPRERATDDHGGAGPTKGVKPWRS